MLFQNRYASFNSTLEKMLKAKQTIGALKVLCFLYEKPESPPDAEALWLFPQPQPLAERIDQRETLQEGGVSPSANILLKNLPKNVYNKGRIDTSSVAADTEKYWVLGSSSDQTQVYTTYRITENLLTWDCELLLYQSISPGSLYPFEYNEDNIAQIDKRINEMVARGYLK